MSSRIQNLLKNCNVVYFMTEAPFPYIYIYIYIYIIINNKIHPLSKLAVTFESIQCNFDIPKIALNLNNIVQFVSKITYINSFWLAGAIKPGEEESHLINAFYQMTESQRCFQSSPWLGPGIINTCLKTNRPYGSFTQKGSFIGFQIKRLGIVSTSIIKLVSNFTGFHIFKSRMNR